MRRVRDEQFEAGLTPGLPRQVRPLGPPVEADRPSRSRAEAIADRWEVELRRAAVAYGAAGGPTASRRVIAAGATAVQVAAAARTELATAVASDPNRARLWELLLVAAFLAAGRRAAAEVASRAGAALRPGHPVPGDGARAAARPGAAGPDHRLRELAEAAHRGDLAEVWSQRAAARPGRPPDASRPRRGTVDRGSGPVPCPAAAGSAPDPGLTGSGPMPRPAAANGPTPAAGATRSGAGGPPAAARTRLVGIHPAGDRPTARCSAGSRTPLPVPLTEMVGRDALLSAVERLLAGRRLVTLTGPGGAGKTRLAVGVARRVAGARACFVDLTAVDDDTRVPEAVASGLGLSGWVDGPGLTELIGVALAADDTFLVLDNCEHVVDGCGALVTRLLDRCPRLRILATSRVTLRVPAEAPVPVPPLGLAPVEPGQSLAGLDRHPATRLFLDRARARRGRPVPAASAAAVARLCAELDGLPLAIELAAAWTPTLSVEEIATRMAADPKLLRSPDPTGPRRHRTLEAAVETSVTRLDDEARLLFEWLAVFPGGFDAEAAVAVRGPAGAGALAALVDASLVTVARPGAVPAGRRPAGADRPPGPSRYRMLKPIRWQALTRLTASGAETSARRAHARYALALAERADDLLRRAYAAEPPPGGAAGRRWSGAGPDLAAHPDQARRAAANQRSSGGGRDLAPHPAAGGRPGRGAGSDPVLRRLRLELPTLRGATTWLSGQVADGDEDLRLAVALATYCERDGRHREGLDWLVGALARRPAAPQPLRARAAAAAGRLMGVAEPASGARQRTGPPPNSRRPARPSRPAGNLAERHPAVNGAAERHPANGLPAERHATNGPVERRPAPEPARPAGAAQPVTAAGSAIQAVPTRRKPARR